MINSFIANHTTRRQNNPRHLSTETRGRAFRLLAGTSTRALASICDRRFNLLDYWWGGVTGGRENLWAAAPTSVTCVQENIAHTWWFFFRISLRKTSWCGWIYFETTVIFSQSLKSMYVDVVFRNDSTRWRSHHPLFCVLHTLLDGDRHNGFSNLAFIFFKKTIFDP